MPTTRQTMRMMASCKKSWMASWRFVMGQGGGESESQ